MKKTIFGLSLLGIGIIIAVIFTVVFMLMVLIMWDVEDDELERDYTWGGEGNFADNEVPAQYIPLYQDAADEFDLPNWELLAAVHRVETVFSTISPMVSSVGAEGHAQFMPCTWVGWGHPTCGGLGSGNITELEKTSPEAIEQYGGYGIDANGDGKADMWDLEDAIFSMANYLSSGYETTGTIEGAVRMYNHSSVYVSNVTGFMNNYQTNLVAKDHTGNQSPVEIAGDKAWVVPAANYISSCFGPRWGRNHNGIDVTAGTPGKVKGYDIVSFMDGRVITSQYNADGWGWYVVVDHGDGLHTLYGHMLEKGVPVGTELRVGDRIGRVGTSGSSTGYHLHFEIHQNGNKIDPLPYVSDFNLQINPEGSNCPA